MGHYKWPCFYFGSCMNSWPLCWPVISLACVSLRVRSLYSFEGALSNDAKERYCKQCLSYVEIWVLSCFTVFLMVSLNFYYFFSHSQHCFPICSGLSRLEWSTEVYFFLHHVTLLCVTTVCGHSVSFFSFLFFLQ